MLRTMKAWHYASGTTARTLSGKLEASLAFDVSAHAPEASTLRPNQVIVQVISAALNHIDYKLPETDAFMKGLGGLPGDSQPGVDFSGRIVDTHPSCKQFTKGQPVCGSLAQASKWGALGQLLVASTSELVALPDGVGFDDAAALGVAAGTAYKALEGIRPGAHVLINGGSGGVGTFAIQLAKLLGAATVTATTSATNEQMVQELGADRTVDYKATPDIVAELETGEHFDLIIDAAGAPLSLYSQSHRILRPGGKFLQVAAHPTSKAMMVVLQKTMRSMFAGPRYRFVMDKGGQDELKQMLQWMKEGKLRSIIGQVYDFDQAIAAYTKLRQGNSGGRVVVHVGSDRENGGVPR